jgi:hypothetical protein
MILTQNVVINGQTYFSGERVANSPGPDWIYTKHMHWLHEHQTALRIANESMFSTSPTYNPRTPEVMLGDNGMNQDINTHDQNTPVV